MKRYKFYLMLNIFISVFLRKSCNCEQLGFLSRLEDIIHDGELIKSSKESIMPLKTSASDKNGNGDCYDSLNPILCQKAKSYCDKVSSTTRELCKETCGLCPETMSSSRQKENAREEDQSNVSTMEKIITINREHDVNLLEGDMVIMNTTEHTRQRRNAMTNHALLWPGRVVPYKIDLSSAPNEQVIKDAFAEIESHTCIRFVPYTNQRDYILIVKETGCWSLVGRYFFKAGLQKLSVGSGCDEEGTIIHELLHALGFLHEQSRPDRNQYVQIFWENIQPGMEDNFDKSTYEAVENHVAYDYGSIMHYGKYTFSKNGKPTILAINQDVDLGQRNAMSVLDATEINSLYKCQDATTISTGWSAWSSYSLCNSQCKKTRQAFCTDQLGSLNCKNANAFGILTQEATCTNAECFAPVNGHWGRWAPWSTCSSSCGEGTTTRLRVCDDPSPANGGSNCPGNNQDSKTCILQGCGTERFSCSFDVDLCEWNLEVKDKSGWYRRFGPTRSGGTGPTGDHTTGSEFYVYYEASSPARTDRPRHLYSNTIPASTGSRCFGFWYSMYGVAMGTLNIILENFEISANTTLKSLSGDQGTGWKFYEVTIDAKFDQRLIFQAIRGYDYRGDIGIDDITVKDGACGATKVIPITLPPTTVGTTTIAPPTTTAIKPTTKAAACTSLQSLGMENGLIKDYQLSATSSYDAKHSAKFARLQQPMAWCAENTKQNQNSFIRIDFELPTYIWLIATQGYPFWDNWMTEYSLELSADGVTFETYKSGGTLMVFNGNSDRSTISTNMLTIPHIAKALKLIPIKWHGNDLCLRFEVYGCTSNQHSLDAGCITPTRAVGLSSGRLPDSMISASSIFNLYHKASFARINNDRVWCSSPTQSSSQQYLQIDIGNSSRVNGIATQGQPTWDNWVTSYKLRYSIDNSYWITYSEKYITKVFSGNYDRNSIVKHNLLNPILARYIQIAPVSHSGNDICMRTEVYICN